MSEQAILYGCIEGSFGSMEDFYGLYTKNEIVLKNLPLDDEWPPLTRNMFSFPYEYGEPGFSRIQVIHFGASFNNFSGAWSTWLKKFEELLKNLFWFSAHLHINIETYGKYEYHWEASSQAIKNFHIKPPVAVGENWLFTGGPRKFNT